MSNLVMKRICYVRKQFLKTTIQPVENLWQIRLFSSTDSTNVDTPNSSSVQYLTNTLGLPLEIAVSVSKKFQLDQNKSENHKSVLSLLRSFHFSDTQIAKVVSKYPQILQSRVENNLKPKLQYLEDIGFVGPLLPKLIVKNVLKGSLEDHMKPTIAFLKEHLKTDDKVVTAVRRESWLLTIDVERIVQPKIDFLLSSGVPASRIGKLICSLPRSLLQKIDKIVYAVEAVKKLQIEPSAPVFLRCVAVLLSISDSTWKRKVEVFKSVGWSKEEIVAAFKREPRCFSCSEEKIRAGMDFYVNTIKLNPGVIASYPNYLRYAVNTKLRRRYNVLKFLESKELLNKEKKLVRILVISEKNFMSTYIEKHLDQFPWLIDLYRGAIAVDKNTAD